MTNPLAAADFFALEAGECLDRLESLTRREDAPPAEDLLRASRVLRGSALMALREGRRSWDPACREQVAQAIEEFRLLVRRVREWDDGDTVRAGKLALSLETLAGLLGRADTRAS